MIGAIFVACTSVALLAILLKNDYKFRLAEYELKREKQHLKQKLKNMEKLNFTQALQALVEGKKIRPTKWREDRYAHIKDNSIVNNEGNKLSCAIAEYDEFEIYTEPEREYSFGEAAEMCITEGDSFYRNTLSGKIIMEMKANTLICKHKDEKVNTVNRFDVLSTWKKINQ